MSVAETPAIDDVLDLMIAEFGSPHLRAVAAYAARYPRYRAELIDFAAIWAHQAYLPAPEPAHPADGVRRVEARAERGLAEALAARAAARQPKSLTALVAASGQDLDDVARRLGLDQSIMNKLERRRIRPETIPAGLTRRLAALLHADPAVVARAWMGPPRTEPAMAAFMAIKLPGEQEDFATAIAASSLSPAQRDALLSGE
jgi:transcriptional regulator with XRE-family HTH domain